MSKPNYVGPGKYQHYKGGQYHVLGLALQEDTVYKPDDPRHPQAEGREQCEKTFVIYRPLTISMLDDREEDFWARELSDFNAMVPNLPFPPDFVPRFTFIGSEAV
jgi:hypothetical protein